MPGHNFFVPRFYQVIVLAMSAVVLTTVAHAKILWSESAPRTVQYTGKGQDILGGVVARSQTNNDTLYFKFHVDPLSDEGAEPYFAGFQLFEGTEERLGLGNALEAWGYSAFNTSETGPSNAIAGEFNLKSEHPEPAGVGEFRPYELVRQGVERTIIFKVEYVPGTNAMVTVWLNPNLGPGASAENQPANLTTKFMAPATFDQIHLRHGQGAKGDGGHGWIFSDMAIATSFDDFIVVHFWQTWWFVSLMVVTLLAGVGGTVRFVEQRKYQMRLRLAEQQHALEQERARIAQDLHDELGSLLTRISLLGGLLKSDKDHPEQVEAHAGKISRAADDTVRALEEIVWAVRPGSDSLQSLVEYIAHFATELFADSPIRCRLDLPAEVPDRPLPPDVRHNIFLIAKESLTNILKHARGQVAFLQVKNEGTAFKLIIADDGRGYEVSSTSRNREHNGLENMRKRAEAVGGTLNLTSEPGKGSRVEFTLVFRS